MVPRPVLGSLCLAASIVFAAPVALAQSAGTYVSGGVGLVIGEDMEMGGPEVELEAGWVGLGALGYAFAEGVSVSKASSPTAAAPSSG